MLSGLVVNLVGQAVAASLHVGLGGFMLVSIMGEAAVLLVMLLYNHIRRDLFSFSLSSVQPRQFFHVVRLGLPAGAEYLYYIIYVFFIYRWIICMGAAVLISVILCLAVPAVVEAFVGDNGQNTALIREQARVSLICLFAGLPFYAANNIFSSVYEVRELMKHAHLNYLLETCVLLIGYSLGLSHLMGITGLWVAYPAAEFTMVLLNFVLMALYNIYSGFGDCGTSGRDERACCHDHYCPFCRRTGFSGTGAGKRLCHAVWMCGRGV